MQPGPYGQIDCKCLLRVQTHRESYYLSTSAVNDTASHRAGWPYLSYGTRLLGPNPRALQTCAQESALEGLDNAVLAAAIWRINSLRRSLAIMALTWAACLHDASSFAPAVAAKALPAAAAASGAPAAAKAASVTSVTSVQACIEPQIFSHVGLIESWQTVNKCWEMWNLKHICFRSCN